MNKEIKFLTDGHKVKVFVDGKELKNLTHVVFEATINSVCFRYTVNGMRECYERRKDEQH